MKSEFVKVVERFGVEAMRKLLRDQRERISMTQRELAEESGVNRSLIAQWEIGGPQLSMEQVATLAETLDRCEGQLLKVLGKASDSILEARERLGMTQAELAKLANVRQETISRAEVGSLKLSDETMERIQKALIEALEKKLKELKAARTGFGTLADLANMDLASYQHLEASVHEPGITRDEMTIALLEGKREWVEKELTAALTDLEDARISAFKQMSTGVRQAKDERDIKSLRDLADFCEEAIKRQEDRAAALDKQVDEIEAELANLKAQEPKE